MENIKYSQKTKHEIILLTMIFAALLLGGIDVFLMSIISDNIAGAIEGIIMILLPISVYLFLLSANTNTIISTKIDKDNVIFNVYNKHYFLKNTKCKK